RDGTTAESLVFSLRRSPHTGGLSGNASAADDPGFEEVVHQGPSGSLEALLDKSVALAVSSDNRHLFVVSARTEATSAGTVLVFSRRAPDAVLGFVEYDKQGDELPGDTPDTIVNLTAPTDVLAVGNHV